MRRRAHQLLLYFAAMMVLSVEMNAAEFKRELSTDRPDRTESPYTVESGRVQFEANLFELSFIDTRPTDTTILRTRYGTFGMIAKYGLSNILDVQLVLGYEGGSSWIEGLDPGLNSSKFPKFRFSDPGIRVKLNLSGNDGGAVAVGLMPFVTLPLGEASSGSWQGGLIIPAAVELGNRAGLGFMVEFDVNADDDGDGHYVEFVTSAVTSFELSSTFGMYLELFQGVDLRGNTPWEPTLDGGLTIAASDNVQIDLGANFGLNQYAADISPFVGLSFRF